MIFLHDKLPSSSVFSYLFRKSSQISHRFTTSSSNKNKLHIPLYRTNRLQSSIRYQSVPYGTQYSWKYKIFPNIPLKSNSKNIFYNCTSDDELDHLLSHFTSAIDRLKVLDGKQAFFDVQQVFELLIGYIGWLL